MAQFSVPQNEGVCPNCGGGFVEEVAQVRLEGAAVQGEQAEGGGRIWVRAVVLGTDTQADAAGLPLLVSWLPGASPLHTGGSSCHRPGRRRRRQLLAHLHTAGGRHFPHRHLHRRRAAARHGGRLWWRLWRGGGSIRQLGSGGEEGAWGWAGRRLLGCLLEGAAWLGG